jgi:hypothetical protein
MYRPRRKYNIIRYLEGCEVVDWNLMADDRLNVKYIIGLSEFSNRIMGLYKP